MTNTTGLLGRLNRAFWLQVGLITLAAMLGIFLARISIEEVLVRQAILQEVEHFWRHYRADPGFHLPDTKNLTGFLDPGELPPAVRDILPAGPGFYEISDLGNRLVLHISEEQGQTLYLIYYRGQVDALVLYYGLLPLLVVLTILYLSLWFAYRFSRRTISPVTRLARQINDIDLDDTELSFMLDDRDFKNDDEIKILADALERLGTRLRAFVTRERNFTRNASHEFRTPLTVINVAVDMMLIENHLPPKSQKSLLKIKRAVYDMEGLTEVFLMLAREDAGALTQAEVDVNQVVRGQIERSAVLKENKDVEIRLNENAQLSLHASETVISVLLGNLIRNAIVYTEQGDIRIDIDAGQITISDSGPGISASSISTIFEPFDRAGNDNAAGFGIGLTIVKRLCDRFGWDIEVHSEPRKGTTFRLRFDDMAAIGEMSQASSG